MNKLPIQGSNAAPPLCIPFPLVSKSKCIFSSSWAPWAYFKSGSLPPPILIHLKHPGLPLQDRMWNWIFFDLGKVKVCVLLLSLLVQISLHAFYIAYNWPQIQWPKTAVIYHLVVEIQTWLSQVLYLGTCCYWAPLPSHVWLFVTLWNAAHQASLSFIISQSLPKFMFIASVMPSSHLIL